MFFKSIHTFPISLSLWLTLFIFLHNYRKVSSQLSLYHFQQLWYPVFLYLVSLSLKNTRGVLFQFRCILIGNYFAWNWPSLTILFRDSCIYLPWQCNWDMPRNGLLVLVFLIIYAWKWPSRGVPPESVLD